jgi:hypothetical protein
MNRRTRTFLALVGAAPLAVALGAVILLSSALAGHHILWRSTDADLPSAIRNHSEVAVKLFIEALPDIDAPIPYSNPRILNARPLLLAPLVIALVHDQEDVVRVLRNAGSDPAKALGRMSPEIAAALLRYAADANNALAFEYLTQYRPEAKSAPGAHPSAPDETRR